MDDDDEGDEVCFSLFALLLNFINILLIQFNEYGDEYEVDQDDVDYEDEYSDDEGENPFVSAFVVVIYIG